MGSGVTVLVQDLLLLLGAAVLLLLLVVAATVDHHLLRTEGVMSCHMLMGKTSLA